jgi:hypothetical protein
MSDSAVPSNSDIDLVNLDLYCSDSTNSPRYRLYIDTDLLVERNYVWDNSQNFVREMCELRLEPGKHTLSIVCENPSIFSIKNVTFNAKPLVLDADGSFVKQ